MELLAFLFTIIFLVSLITYIFRKLMNKEDLKHNTKIMFYAYIVMAVTNGVAAGESSVDAVRFMIVMANIGLFVFLGWNLLNGKNEVKKHLKIWLGLMPLQVIGDILLYTEYDVFQNVVDFSFMLSMQLLILLSIAMYKRHELGEFLGKGLVACASVGTLFFTISPPIEVLQVTVNFIVLIVIQAPIAFVIWRLYLKCYNSNPKIEKVVDVK